MHRLLVDAFEEDLADWTDGVSCVAVSSAGAALHIAYAVLGLGPGDDLVTSPLAGVSAVMAALSRGARVLFADVEDDTANLDPKAVADLLTARTRLVTAVDHAGHPAEYDDLRTLTDGVGAALVGDAGEALGATYRGVTAGGLADLTTFCVDAGASAWAGVLAVADERLLTAVRQLREPGFGGLDLRLTGLLAAVGRAQLRRTAADNTRRAALVARYRRQLADVSGLRLPVQRAWVEPAWQHFAVRVLDGRRDEVALLLRTAGVELPEAYPPAYLRSDLADLGYRRGMCPVAERLWAEQLCLPARPDLSCASHDLAISIVRDALN